MHAWQMVQTADCSRAMSLFLYTVASKNRAIATLRQNCVTIHVTSPDDDRCSNFSHQRGLAGKSVASLKMPRRVSNARRVAALPCEIPRTCSTDTFCATVYLLTSTVKIKQLCGLVQWTLIGGPLPFRTLRTVRAATWQGVKPLG